MGILYRQEEKGFKHVIEIKNEKWSFSTKNEYEDCVTLMIAHNIPFTTNYSFELLHIEIPAARIFIGSEDDGLNKIKENDQNIIRILSELIKWKTKGTRPLLSIHNDLKLEAFTNEL